MSHLTAIKTKIPAKTIFRYTKAAKFVVIGVMLSFLITLGSLVWVVLI